MNPRLELLGSYTSMTGEHCYKWLVKRGGLLRLWIVGGNPQPTTERIKAGDIVQCTAEQFWSGTCDFTKGFNTNVDKAARPALRAVTP